MECTPEIVISQMGLLRVLVRDTACVDVGMHCSFVVVVVVVVVVLCQRDGSCRGHSAHRSWQGRWNGFVSGDPIVVWMVHAALSESLFQC